jgi:hypothetical protein
MLSLSLSHTHTHTHTHKVRQPLDHGKDWHGEFGTFLVIMQPYVTSDIDMPL